MDNDRWFNLIFAILMMCVALGALGLVVALVIAAMTGQLNTYDVTLHGVPGA